MKFGWQNGKSSEKSGEKGCVSCPLQDLIWDTVQEGVGSDSGTRIPIIPKKKKITYSTTARETALSPHKL